MTLLHIIVNLSIECSPTGEKRWPDVHLGQLKKAAWDAVEPLVPKRYFPSFNPMTLYTVLSRKRPKAIEQIGLAKC